MGKKLIIKGADFSANCIPQEIVWTNITDRLTIQKGISGVTTAESSDENAVYPRFDVSEFSVIKFVIAKSGVGPFFSSMETGNTSAAANREYLAAMFDAREPSGTVYITPGTYEVNMADVGERLIYIGAKLYIPLAGDHDNASDYMEVYAY